MSIWGEDDGKEVVYIPITLETWNQINTSPEPVGEVHRRGLDRLRMSYQMDEGEIEVIGKDPVYIESCRREYWKSMRMVDKSRKLPRRLELDYSRPGSRDRHMKLVEEPT